MLFFLNLKMVDPFSELHESKPHESEVHLPHCLRHKFRRLGSK